MWYNYLILFTGAAIVIYAIYSMVTNRSVSTMSILGAIAGGVVSLYGAYGIMTPTQTPGMIPTAVTSTVNTAMTGGKRILSKLFK